MIIRTICGISAPVMFFGGLVLLTITTRTTDMADCYTTKSIVLIIGGFVAAIGALSKNTEG